MDENLGYTFSRPDKEAESPDSGLGYVYEPSKKELTPVSGGYSIEKPKTYAPLGASAAEYEKIPSEEVFGRSTKTFIPSAIKEAKQTVEQFYPSNIPQTLLNIGQLGYGLGSKALGAIGVKETPEKKAQDEALLDATIQYFKDRYGSLGGIKKAIAEEPASVLGDISLPLQGIGGIAKRAPGLLGAPGRIAKTVGEVSVPAIGPAKLGAGLAGAVRDYALGAAGHLAGTSSEGIREARRAAADMNPDFWRSYHGDISDQQLVKDVRNSIASKSQETSNKYVDSMKKITGGTLPSLDYGKVDKALSDTFDKLHYGPEKIELDPSVTEALSKVNQYINDWKSLPYDEYHNIAGFDALKKRLDRMHGQYKDAGLANVADLAIGPARNAVYKTIEESHPEYAKVMEDYDTRKKHVEDFYKELSSGRKAATGTTLRALINAGKSGRKSRLLAELTEMDPSLSAKIAGKEIAEAQAAHEGRHGITPGDVGRYATALASAAAGFGIHPALGLAAAAPFATPERVAKLAYISGVPEIPLSLAKKYAGPAVQKLPTMAYGANLLGDVEAQRDRLQGGYATGGRINRGMTAQMLIAAVERAKADGQKATEQILDQPDEHVVHALKVANQHI